MLIYAELQGASPLDPIRGAYSAPLKPPTVYIATTLRLKAYGFHRASRADILQTAREHFLPYL